MSPEPHPAGRHHGEQHHDHDHGQAHVHAAPAASGAIDDVAVWSLVRASLASRLMVVGLACVLIWLAVAVAIR